MAVSAGTCRSRRGTDLAGMFPEIVAAMAQTVGRAALDGVM